MKVIWIFAIVTVTGRQYGTILGAPLTKWFKTDNSTYYIEEHEKFTWQQSYHKCLKKNMALITVKDYKESELLLQYLALNFNPMPEFWLKSNDNVDLNDINKLLGSMLAADILNINFDDGIKPQIINSNSPENCILTANGAVKACEALHGYICHEYKSKDSGGQNVQNVILKFN